MCCTVSISHYVSAHSIRTYYTVDEPAPSSKYCAEDGGNRDGTSFSNGAQIADRSDSPHQGTELSSWPLCLFKSFMLASVFSPCESCKHYSLCLVRAYSFAAFLAASFPSTSVQPIAVGLASMCHLAPIKYASSLSSARRPGPQEGPYTYSVSSDSRGSKNVIFPGTQDLQC